MQEKFKEKRAEKAKVGCVFGLIQNRISSSPYKYFFFFFGFFSRYLGVLVIIHSYHSSCSRFPSQEKQKEKEAKAAAAAVGDGATGSGSGEVDLDANIESTLEEEKEGALLLTDGKGIELTSALGPGDEAARASSEKDRDEEASQEVRLFLRTGCQRWQSVSCLT